VHYPDAATQLRDELRRAWLRVRSRLAKDDAVHAE